MYRNLDAGALGISGRQSELIELALTYGFDGLDLDFDALTRRARRSGIDAACQLVTSAGVRVGEFELPVALTAPEVTFRASMKDLGLVAELAQALHAGCARVQVAPVSDGMTYQQNFELHRARIFEIADLFARHNVPVGLAFAAESLRLQDGQQPFIQTSEALLTLIRTIGHPHVGLALDTWSWFVGGGSLDALLALPPASIMAVRCADIPIDVDLATISVQQRAIPGEGGVIDNRAVVQHLAAHEHAGPVTLAPAPDSYCGLTREAIAQQARATLDDLMSETPPVSDSAGETSDELSLEAIASQASAE